MQKQQDRSKKPIASAKLTSGWRPSHLLDVTSSIRSKIVFPFLILTLIVAILGVFIVTRLIAGSFEERFTNQLLEAGRVAADAVVRQEARQLEALRPIAQTQGIPEAIEDEDIERIIDLTEVHAYNANLDSVLVLDSAGNLVVRMDAIRRTTIDAIDEFQYASGGNYAGYPLVANILAGYVDRRGDKYANIVDTPAGPILYTSAPVYSVTATDSEGEALLAGIVLAGTRLDRILIRIKNESLADITVYSDEKTILSSTIADWEEPDQYVALLPNPVLYREALESPEETPLSDVEDIELFGRAYRAAYAPMRVRDIIVGVIGIYLPSSFVIQTVGASRDTFILIFIAASLVTVVIGLLIARRIARPIRELVLLSRAVAQGDLTQRARIMSRDEVGTLATTFNHMTERLQAYTTALEEENAKTSAILDSIADGVIVRDAKGEIVLMNPAAKDLLATEAGDMDLGFLRNFTSLLDFIDPSYRIEVGPRTIGVSAAPVLLPGGEGAGEVLVLRDVTHEAIAEKTKDNFLNQIGHELRTPLTSLQGFAEVLARGYDELKPETRKRAAEQVFNQTRILAEMINQIIDLTAMQSGPINLKRTEVDLDAMITDTLEELAEELRFSRNEVRYVPTPSKVILHADRRRLMTVLNALLRNAHLYSPPGSPIEVKLQRNGEHALITVTDYGVGISDKDRPHIFERFYRGTPLDKDGNLIDVRGMGQGLYIAKSVVEGHGGTITLESTPQHGSTFTVRLPLHETIGTSK